MCTKTRTMSSVLHALRSAGGDDDDEEAHDFLLSDGGHSIEELHHSGKSSCLSCDPWSDPAILIGLFQQIGPIDNTLRLTLYENERTH